MDTDSDLIMTIDSDDEVINSELDDSENEEEVHVTTVKARIQKKAESKLFSSGFKFELQGSNLFEPTSSIEAAIEKGLKKKKARTTVEEKISNIRASKAKENNQATVEIVVKDDVDEQVDSDEEFAPSNKDSLRIKGKANIEEEEDIKDEIVLAEVIDDHDHNNIGCNLNIHFSDMNLSRPLMKAVNDLDYITPTPIQQAAIPVILKGRDVSGCAATGTGKSAAFLLPVIERLINRPTTIATTRVLLLAPVRELGVQLFTVATELCKYTNIRICLAVGGHDIKTQEASLRTNPDIVIATPGRLIDHLHNCPSFDLNSIEILILDEADRMLDEHFKDQMKEILDVCSKQRQTLLFGATVSTELDQLANIALKRPVRVRVNSSEEVAPFLKQEFIKIREEREGDREAILCALLSRTYLTNVMVFCQTKKQAHRLHIVLGLLKPQIKAAELHGDLCQAERMKSLNRFKNGDADVLVCSDLASRGLDISGVKTVINLTMPNTLTHYIQRVGRTARARKKGVSVSLVGETERPLLKQVLKMAKRSVEKRKIHESVVAAYKDVLDNLESEVGEVLRMEANERKILAAENQINRMEKKFVKGETPAIQRSWFQSEVERRISRIEKSLDHHSSAGGGKKKHKPNLAKPSNADSRMKQELSKSEKFRLKSASRMEVRQGRFKKSGKQKKVGRCVDPEPPKKKRKEASKAKKSGGFFDKEVSNSGKKSKNQRFKGNKKKGNKMR